MKRIARSAIVEHAAPEMYALVEDIERYPEFLPWCRAACVRERGAGRTVATLDVGLKGAHYEFTTENSHQPPASIAMKLRAGPFRHFAARWHFRPLGDSATRVEYAMEYEFSSRVVAAALSPVFHAIADTMVDAFKRRADRIYGEAAR